MKHLVQHAYDFITARNIEIFVNDKDEELKLRVHDKKRNNFKLSKRQSDEIFEKFQTDLHRDYTKGSSCPQNPQADPHRDLREHFENITNHARDSIDSFMFDSANIDEYEYDFIPEFTYEGRVEPKAKAGLVNPLGAIANLVTTDTRFADFCKEFKEYVMRTIVKPNLDKVEHDISQQREQSQLNASFKYQIHRRQNEVAMYFHEKTKNLDVCNSGYNWKVRTVGIRFIKELKMVRMHICMCLSRCLYGSNCCRLPPTTAKLLGAHCHNYVQNESMLHIY